MTEPVQLAAVRIAEIVDQPIDVEAHRRAVSVPAGGGVVVFCGVVRDHDDDRAVVRLEYSAHPSAANVLRDVAGRAAKDRAVLAIAVTHRTGSLEVGDLALVAAVSTAHRAEAFAACARLVDDVKHSLPIWKRQIFSDGSEQWVNCP